VNLEIRQNSNSRISGKQFPKKALPWNRVDEITLSLLKFKALSWLIQSVQKGEFKEKIQSIFKMIHAK